LTAASATTGTSDRQGRKIAEAELRVAAGDETHCIGRAGAALNRRHVDALLLEIALLLGDEEHRVVAAHDIVELHDDLVGGDSRGSEQAVDSGRDDASMNLHRSLHSHRRFRHLGGLNILAGYALSG
jgi:hypothetical protein